jgi:glutamate/tyrosine decarboxylase-like PLP-dependent enzyme
MAKQKNHSHLNLSGEEMKVFGYQVVDRLVEHFLALESKPVTRIGTSSGLSSLFAERPPEDPSPPAEILTQVIDDIFGHMMHTTHPKFMAFVPSPSNFISVMADALVSGYNPFAGTWMEASGPAQVELVTINWLRQLFGLPDSAGGLFTSGGSMANLTGLAVARDTRLGEEFTAGVIYASDQTHASLARGLRVLGFSSGQYKILPADLAYRLPLAQLEHEIIADRAAGRRPFCVIANAGSTNTGAVDPLPGLAALCQRENLWLHVDAAYGGAAILTDFGREMLAGLEMADSLVIDPHKWLFQPYEIGCILVRDQDLLRESFNYNPEYLQDLQGEQAGINYSEYGVQLTRSFRALKLWMSIMVFGLAAFRAAVARGFELAKVAEEEISRRTLFELVTPAQMGVVTFRIRPPSAAEDELEHLNRALVEAVIAAGFAMISSTRLRGRTVLRLCLINPRTEAGDVGRVLEHVEELGRKLV